MLHGYTQSAASAEYFSRFSLKSDKEGFIVVYPQGTVFHFGAPDWHIKQFADYTPDTGPDDVGFISSSTGLNEITESRPEIYITGFSAGGFMAHLLGAELADRIARRWRACRPACPWGCS